MHEWIEGSNPLTIDKLVRFSSSKICPDEIKN